MAVGAVIFVIIMIYSLDEYTWLQGYGDNWETILGFLVLIGLVIAVVASGKSREGK
jgi:cytochrome c oxidase subunit IV